MFRKLFSIGFLSAAVLFVGCQSNSTQPDRTAQPNDNRNAANQNSSTSHSETNGEIMNHSTMQSAPNAASAPYDLQFLDTMISHHQGAVDMANFAAVKAEHAELKALAASIVADQENEIAQMNRWRDKWFAGEASALNMEMSGMTDSMKGMDMNALNSLSGNAYDIEFINQMTPHHADAVEMAREASGKAEHAEIKTLANQIIKSQEAEIKTMQDWKAKWSK